MNKLQKLMAEITQLTSNIETNYPELYKYLDENPMTIPNDPHPKMDAAVMESYLAGLKKQLHVLLDEHSKKRVKTQT